MHPNPEQAQTQFSGIVQVVNARGLKLGGRWFDYARSSAGPHVSSLERRVLILTAQDDPLVPVASVARWPRLARRCASAPGRLH